MKGLTKVGFPTYLRCLSWLVIGTIFYLWTESESVVLLYGYRINWDEEFQSRELERISADFRFSNLTYRIYYTHVSTTVPNFNLYMFLSSCSTIIQSHCRKK
ncbi:hypothetical protein Dimus_034979 [Dionaea muscipula]